MKDDCRSEAATRQALQYADTKLPSIYINPKTMETGIVFVFDFFTTKLSYVAENKNTSSTLDLECYGGVRDTRIAQLALLCIVSLAVASTIGLAVLSTVALQIDTTTLRSFLDAPRLTRSIIGNILPMGDPIDDPKPNNLKH